MSKGSILFVSKRRGAASTRYRIFQYWDYLRDQGWSLDYHSATDSRAQLLRKCAQADIVVIQRRLFDSFTLALLRRINDNIVFDYDDAIFLNDDGSPSARRNKRFSNITQSAELCLAGNSYLASHSQAQRTVVFPTTVELSNYRDLPKRSASPTLTLVWVGSRSTSRYLEQYRNMLQSLGREVSNVELKVIGDFTIDFANLSTRCIPWTAEGEIPELAESDIGIAPMTDDPWTRGKCALKIIQYMACGLPVISSDCGANAEVVVDGQTGVLAATTEQWIDAVRSLGDQSLREKMGNAGLERVKTHYSAEILAGKMGNLFTEMLAARD